MDFKKHIWLYLIVIVNFSLSQAQNVRSVTDAEAVSSIDNFINIGSSNFEQSLFWRTRYNKEGKERDSYIFHSLYFRDSVVGLKYFGFEFNLMHEAFEKSVRLNKFRKWNIIRLGGALSAEHNFWREYYPIEDAFEYFNDIRWQAPSAGVQPYGFFKNSIGEGKRR